MEHCRACGDGWGTCRSEGKCVLKDDFSDVYSQLKESDGIVFVSAVYWSEMTECFNDPSIHGYNISAKGTYDFYSNGVAITSVDMCEETVVDGSSIVSPGGNKFVETYVAAEDALLCREEQYSPYTADISYEVYEPLKNDGVVHPCWGIHEDSMALIGTHVLRTIKKEKIFYYTEDFRKFLEANN